MKRLLTMLCIGVTLAGCGTLSSLRGGEPDPDAPAPLPEIAQPFGLERAWSHDFGAAPGDTGVELEPVLAGSAVYVADVKGNVTAYRRDNGDRLWRTGLDTALSAGVGYADGLVVVVSRDGIVHALEAEDGARAWQASIAGEVLSPPSGDRGTIVLRTEDGRVVGLSSATGVRRWSYQREVPSLTLRGGSRPLVARGAAIVGFASGRIVASDIENGRIYWDVPVTAPSGRNEIERLADLDAAPLLIGDVLYVAAYQDRITAVDLRNQRIVWTREISTYRNMAADNRRLFVAGGDGRVHALRRDSGDTAWSQDALARRTLSGVTTLGRWVVVGDEDGNVHFLSRETGELEGRTRVGDPVRVAPLSDGEQVYVIAGGDRITAVRPAAE